MSRFLSLKVAGIVLLTLLAGSFTYAGLRARQEAPKPGPEHKALEHHVGTWDAVVEMAGQKSKGEEVVSMGCGGLWQISDFKAELMGAPFAGHGMTCWSPAKKKYVTYWGDSWTAEVTILEGEASKDGKVLTQTFVGPGPTGENVTQKHVSTMIDEKQRTLTMYMVQDGKDVEMMKITYTKR